MEKTCKNLFVISLCICLVISVSLLIRRSVLPKIKSKTEIVRVDSTNYYKHLLKEKEEDICDIKIKYDLLREDYNALESEFNRVVRNELKSREIKHLRGGKISDRDQSIKYFCGICWEIIRERNGYEKQ